MPSLCGLFRSLYGCLLGAFQRTQARQLAQLCRLVTRVLRGVQVRFFELTSVGTGVLQSGCVRLFVGGSFVVLGCGQLANGLCRFTDCVNLFLALGDLRIQVSRVFHPQVVPLVQSLGFFFQRFRAFFRSSGFCKLGVHQRGAAQHQLTNLGDLAQCSERCQEVLRLLHFGQFFLFVDALLHIGQVRSERSLRVGDCFFGCCFAGLCTFFVEGREHIVVLLLAYQPGFQQFGVVRNQLVAVTQPLCAFVVLVEIRKQFFQLDFFFSVGNLVLLRSVNGSKVRKARIFFGGVVALLRVNIAPPL